MRFIEIIIRNKVLLPLSVSSLNKHLIMYITRGMSNHKKKWVNALLSLLYGLRIIRNKVAFPLRIRTSHHKINK